MKYGIPIKNTLFSMLDLHVMEIIYRGIYDNVVQQINIKVEGYDAEIDFFSSEDSLEEHEEYHIYNSIQFYKYVQLLVAPKQNRKMFDQQFEYFINYDNLVRKFKSYEETNEQDGWMKIVIPIVNRCVDEKYFSLEYPNDDSLSGHIHSFDYVFYDETVTVRLDNCRFGEISISIYNTEYTIDIRTWLERKTGKFIQVSNKNNSYIPMKLVNQLRKTPMPIPKGYGFCGIIM